MAQIINLKSARKRKERLKTRQEADENAARFGRSKALKSLEMARSDKLKTDLDAHKLEEPDG
jgi:hypothetical protein